jgi:hypothetical protein
MSIANTPAPKEVVTAALLVIGDKILSGRTKDKNIGFIAQYLTSLGIDLMEVRVVGDNETAIVDVLNTLRHRYTYVFTTGGIGPTHDDITADSVAKAFGVPIDTDPQHCTGDCLDGRAHCAGVRPKGRDSDGRVRPASHREGLDVRSQERARYLSIVHLKRLAFFFAPPSNTARQAGLR